MKKLNIDNFIAERISILIHKKPAIELINKINEMIEAINQLQIKEYSEEVGYVGGDLEDEGLELD